MRRSHLHALMTAYDLEQDEGMVLVASKHVHRSTIMGCVRHHWLRKLDEAVFHEDDSDCEHPHEGYALTEAGRRVVLERKAREP